MEDQKKEPRKRLKKPMSAAQYLQTRLSHFAFRHVVSDFSELPERTRQIMVRYYFDLAPIESISEEVGLTGVRIKQIAEKGARRVYKITSQSCRLWDESIRQSNEIYALKAQLQLLQRKWLEVDKVMRMGDTYTDAVSLTTIEDIDLSVRAYNSLKAMKVNTIGDIMGKTVDDIMSARNTGKKTVIEIEETMKAHGIVWPVK